MVAIGERLADQGRCPGVTLALQGQPITTDFYLLTLDMCYMVIRAYWLRTLGPIPWDF